jgi:hypothetical protein
MIDTQNICPARTPAATAPELFVAISGEWTSVAGVQDFQVITHEFTRSLKHRFVETAA